MARSYGVQRVSGDLESSIGWALDEYQSTSWPNKVAEPWRQVGSLDGYEYGWPEGIDVYEPFMILQRDGAVPAPRFGVGFNVSRREYYGRERGWVVVFAMVGTKPSRPVVVFNETDDFAVTGDYVAVIRGKGAGGRSMFAPGDTLPEDYDGMPIETFRDRITGPRSLNRLAIVARAGDVATMAEHGWLQTRLRGDVADGGAEPDRE